MKDIFKIKNFVFQRNIKIDYFLKIILKGIKNKLYRIYFLKNLSFNSKKFNLQVLFMPDPVFSHTRRHVVSVVMVIIHHFHGHFGKVMES